MKPKAVIFDLDGTLLDSMSVWDNIGAEYLASCGIDPPQNLSETLKNMSFTQSAQYFIDVFNVPFSVSEIIGKINSRVKNKYRNSIELKPFVEQYLHNLKKENIPLCIATATDHSLASAALERLNVLSLFDFILTCAQVGSGKDNEAIYVQAAAKLGFEPQDICVFEDSLFCIKTAKQAGFAVIGVYDESSKADFEQIKEISDQTIYTFEEMM